MSSECKAYITLKEIQIASHYVSDIFFLTDELYGRLYDIKTLRLALDTKKISNPR